MKTRDELIDDLLTLAFAEDVGDGDATTLSTIPAEETGRQQLIVKEEGILAGVDIARKVFHKFDPSLKMTEYISDGAHVRPGDIAFVVEGPVRSLLQTERIMLNIMQRMSGVATMTDRYQQRLAGLKTKVLDTRKTTPGMRLLEKEAVRIGGGSNHRIGLFDMILIRIITLTLPGAYLRLSQLQKNGAQTTARTFRLNWRCVTRKKSIWPWQPE